MTYSIFSFFFLFLPRKCEQTINLISFAQVNPSPRVNQVSCDRNFDQHTVEEQEFGNNVDILIHAEIPEREEWNSFQKIIYSNIVIINRILKLPSY